MVSRQNGYHYPPFLQEQPAGPEAQSYALRTLDELGRRPRTSASAARVASLRREALASSPLWGRNWLVPLRRAGASEALGAGDARAVKRLRARGGWYTDPALGDDTDAARLGATWAALDVLEALGELRDVPTADRDVTAKWLHSRAAKSMPLDQGAALASALRLLDRPVPHALTTVAAPRTDDWASLTPAGRTDRLNDTYHYVLIQEAAGRRPRIDRGIWEAVLREGAAGLPYEQLYCLVRVLKTAGSPDSLFAPVGRRLDEARIDDGTVRDPAAYLGNPDASLFVERLRALAGWSRRDPRLLAALDREEKAGNASREDTERLARAALRRVASGGPTSEDARRLCADDAVLPTTVTENNATRWQRTALNCADAGVDIGAPEIGTWKPDTPGAVVAAATVTVGLADAGLHERGPTWMDARDLQPWARNPGRFPSLYDYSLVVRAYSLLGGVLDAELEEALGSGVTPYRGCPGLPDVYQVGDGDPACDLKTTWGVWALDRQLGGVMGWGPAATGNGQRTGARR
ncbi:hypothetical protein [Streptomyces sp. CC219B]|uniref:hypothetical protein n=1 Tax=Streptomyces sp. CC219B TaxID=3044574 RepID=UPI0024A8D6C5|nr:hypothetical protein [Streptomyces sp. CC219B]